jgi:hypothetical protein
MLNIYKYYWREFLSRYYSINSNKDTPFRSEDSMTKTFSHIMKTFILLITLSFCVGTAFGQKGVLLSDLHNSFTNFNLVRLDSQETLTKVEKRQQISISLAEKTFDLILIPRDMRSPEYRAEETTTVGLRSLEKGKVTTFKGKVANVSNSQVRMSIDGTKIEGYFKADGEQYFIEPAKRYSTYGDEKDYIVYRSGDFLSDEGISCESEFAAKIEKGKDMFEVSDLQTPQSLKVVRIATEADQELINSFGSSSQANNGILSLLNMIEGSYETDLNLTFTIVYQHTWAAATPYNNSTPTTLLDAFKAYWQLNFPPSQINRDLAFYFTGKANRAGIGASKFSRLCNPDEAYALSGNINNFEANSVLMAHEIGHIVGASHAEVAQSCANTIMNQFISNLTPMVFCTFSRNEVTNNVSLNGGCLANQISSAVRFDFDGDSRADISVFRPSNGVWYVNRSSSGVNVFQFGQNGDKPVSADYDGDGIADAAVYRSGAWYSLNSSDGTFRATSFGFATDIPVPGDFDADGKADVAVFRPSNGNWYRLSSIDGAYSAIQFGAEGDIPVPGDFDGDGKADLTIFRPSNGVWYRVNSATDSFFAAQFGSNGDKPIKGDFDGDGLADLAVWRPSNGGWYNLNSSNGGFVAIGFGLSTDVPVAADYDGDGRTDISIFRPSDGYWHLLSSGSNNSYTAMPFGNGSDIPVPSF